MSNSNSAMLELPEPIRYVPSQEVGDTSSESEDEDGISIPYVLMLQNRPLTS